MEQVNTTGQQTPSKSKHIIYCTACSDSGVLQAERTDVVAGVYAFRCSYCLRGRNDPKLFPLWDSQPKFKLLRGL